LFLGPSKSPHSLPVVGSPVIQASNTVTFHHESDSLIEENRDEARDLMAAQMADGVHANLPYFRIKSTVL